MATWLLNDDDRDLISLSITMRNTSQIPEPVMKAYGLAPADWHITPFGNGLINHTWKLDQNGTSYILQRINHQVFKKPEDIAHNMTVLARHLGTAYPDYHFVAAQPTQDGQTICFAGGDGYYRLFPFVAGSHTIDVVHTPEQAFEAARQFGRFTRLLDQLDVRQLRITIPSFHDITLRYQQFIHSIEAGNRERVRETQPVIRQLLNYSELVNRYENMRRNPEFHLRVIHHDTKISNVLFDNEEKGICVIDLDTVMPGYFISDLGDMMRTYLCPVSEEEKDLGKITVREDIYRAIIRGYLSEMEPVLSRAELGQLFYAGQFMIYMQALRFLTDHLLGDIYYGALYPDHNLFRARNQLRLLEKLSEKEESWVNNLLI